MKLDDLLKDKMVDSVHRHNTTKNPSWYQTDKESPAGIEERLMRYKSAREQYMRAGNSPMVVKMDARIRDYEERLKDTTIVRTRT